MQKRASSKKENEPEPHIGSIDNQANVAKIETQYIKKTLVGVTLPKALDI